MMLSSYTIVTYATYFQSYILGSPDGRFKREERTMPGGCGCHRTAVAIAALSQYVRYITEYYVDHFSAESMSYDIHKYKTGG